MSYYSLIHPPVLIGSIVTLAFTVLAVYIALYRVQKAEGRLDRLRDRYEEMADAFSRLSSDRAQTDARVVGAINSATLHGAQLKGTGERLRTLEAKVESNSRTVDSILTVGKAPGAANAVDIKPSKVAKNLAILELKAKVSSLSARMFGGTTEDGMPVPGEMVGLRLQVEGINANLGQRLNTNSSSLVLLKGSVKAMKLKASNTITRRIWRWLTKYDGVGISKP